LNQHAQQFGTEQTELVYNAREAQPAEPWTPSLEDVLTRDVRRRLVRNGNQSSKVVRRNAATGQMLDSSFQANPETGIGTPPFEDEKLSQNDDSEPLARATDPPQSHEAADAIRPHLADLQARTLEAIRAHPGHTSTELARLYGFADPRVFNRRASELHKAGLIVARNVRRCTVTGRNAAEWVAVIPKE
jgi:hypothetical protein